jgi:hypothetical protein
MIKSPSAMASLHQEGAAGEVKVSNNWSTSQKELFRAQLAKVLDSSQFRSSRRCTLFLRCVGEHVVENRLDSLKERTLGIEVFERDPAYDTNQDPIVRSTAVEVRKRLAQYYLDPGHETEPRISLPAGSYVAEIHPAPGAARPFLPWRSFSKKVWLVAAGAVLLIAAATLAVLSFRNANLDRFWQPFTSSPGPITICHGQPRTYVFVAPQQGRIRAWSENHAADRTPPPELASIPLQQIVPTWGRHIDISDAQSYERLATLFAKKGRTVQLRGDLSVALSELRRHPTILIGVFNNDWTLGLAGELRLYFQADSGNQVEMVRRILTTTDRSLSPALGSASSGKSSFPVALETRNSENGTEPACSRLTRATGWWLRPRPKTSISSQPIPSGCTWTSMHAGINKMSRGLTS